jgi:hypothetical protein
MPVPYPALVTEPGSTIDICVQYVNYFNQTTSGPLHPSVYVWTATGQSAQPQAVSITASPADIDLTQGQRVEVDYRVTTGAASQGFYGIALFQICEPLPLAVGYPASAVSFGNFPGAYAPRACGGQALSAEIVGYGGASLANVHN